jgi:hypothetical protein
VTSSATPTFAMTIEERSSSWVERIDPLGSARNVWDISLGWMYWDALFCAVIANRFNTVICALVCVSTATGCPNIGGPPGSSRTNEAGGGCE